MTTSEFKKKMQLLSDELLIVRAKLPSTKEDQKKIIDSILKERAKKALERKQSINKKVTATRKQVKKENTVVVATSLKNGDKVLFNVKGVDKTNSLIEGKVIKTWNYSRDNKEYCKVITSELKTYVKRASKLTIVTK